MWKTPLFTSKTPLILKRLSCPDDDFMSQVYYIILPHCSTWGGNSGDSNKVVVERVSVLQKDGVRLDDLPRQQSLLLPAEMDSSTRNQIEPLETVSYCFIFSIINGCYIWKFSTIPAACKSLVPGPWMWGHCLATSGHDEQCSQPESKRRLPVRPRIHLMDFASWVDPHFCWWNLELGCINALPDISWNITCHLVGAMCCIGDVMMSSHLKATKDKFCATQHVPTSCVVFSVSVALWWAIMSRNPTAKIISKHWRTALRNFGSLRWHFPLSRVPTLQRTLQHLKLQEVVHGMKQAA